MGERKPSLDGYTVGACLFAGPGTLGAGSRIAASQLGILQHSHLLPPLCANIKIVGAQDNVEAAVLGGGQNDIFHRIVEPSAQAVVRAVVGESGKSDLPLGFELMDELVIRLVFDLGEGRSRFFAIIQLWGLKIDLLLPSNWAASLIF